MEQNTILKYANDNMPLTDAKKNTMIKKASKAYGKFMDALQIDWKNDPNSMDTPKRVAKSFVYDLIEGCYNEPPLITAFNNLNGYDGMIFEGNIKVHSICSHHHVPFLGVAHVAYVPDKKGKIIGLSKINRTVEFFARRPQVQENLTMQISDYLNEIIEGNLGIAVMIEAKHLCACIRGVKHDGVMKTAKLSGIFQEDPEAREEFYNFIRDLKR